jgi:hypothetical protein
VPFDAPEDGGLKPVLTLKSEDAGERMDVLVHPLEWPKEVIEKHYDSYVYLFRDLLPKQTSEPTLTEDDRAVKVCLCVEVTSCPFKTVKAEDRSGIENRSCRFFSNGLCLVAVDPESGKRLIPPTKVLAYLARTSPRDLDRRFERFKKKVGELLLQNPMIRETLGEMGLRKLLDNAEDKGA